MITDGQIAKLVMDGNIDIAYDLAGEDRTDKTAKRVSVQRDAYKGHLEFIHQTLVNEIAGLDDTITKSNINEELQVYMFLLDEDISLDSRIDRCILEGFEQYATV